MTEKPSVMIVEDEKDLAENLRDIVESTQKYRGVFALSAAEAFHLLEENKISGGSKIKCILLDIKMPGMDGLQFLEQVKKDYRDDFGVIMVTAYEDDNKWDRALKEKVIGYIKKPFTSEEVLRALDCFFEGEEGATSMRISTYDQYFEKFKKYKRE